MDSPPLPSEPARRNFLSKALSIVIGGAMAVVPVISGLAVFFDPLRAKRRQTAANAVRVASLTSLPENGEPRKFQVLQTREDAWNRTPNIPVGAVYLQRIAPDKVRAFNAKCPHTGCFVNFKGDLKHFHCPCHDSTFALDGEILARNSPSPRALDELLVEIRDGTEVYVHFQNFRSGVSAKEAV